EREQLRVFWAAYEPVWDEVRAELMASPEATRAFATVLDAGAPSPAEVQADLERQRRAVLHDEWEPYLDDLHEQGSRFATTGIEFSAWFHLVSAFRRILVRHTVSRTPNERTVHDVLLGADRFIDLALTTI